MTFNRVVFSLLLFFSLAACVRDTLTFKPVASDANRAVIYIYRPATMGNAMISPVLAINGIDRFPVKNGHYSYLYLEPQHYVFELKMDDRISGLKRIELDVRPNQLYFFKVGSQLKFMKQEKETFNRSFMLERITEARAKQEIRTCTYVVPEFPSKYLWSKSTVESAAPDGGSEQEAEFDLTKSRDPFSKQK